MGKSAIGGFAALSVIPLFISGRNVQCEQKFFAIFQMKNIFLQTLFVIQVRRFLIEETENLYLWQFHWETTY